MSDLTINLICGFLAGFFEFLVKVGSICFVCFIAFLAIIISEHLFDKNQDGALTFQTAKVQSRNGIGGLILRYLILALLLLLLSGCGQKTQENERISVPFFTIPLYPTSAEAGE